MAKCPSQMGAFNISATCDRHHCVDCRVKDKKYSIEECPACDAKSNAYTPARHKQELVESAQKVWITGEMVECECGEITTLEDLKW